MIFLNARHTNLKKFQSFLQAYQSSSGQLVNYSKSQFVPSSSISTAQLQRMGQILHMPSSDLPIKYLGSYLYRGINRACYCTTLLKHFDAKLTGWAHKLLTPGSRLVLLKTVLMSLPLHLLAAARLPKSFISAINKKLARFIWGDKYHWIKFERLCYPEIEGGLGIRNLSCLQQAYDCKLWWHYHNKQTVCSTYMHLKYGTRADYIPRLFDSPTWKRICSIHQTCLHLSSGHPNPVWNSSLTGDFTLRASYEDLRPTRPQLYSHKFIWWRQIPKTVSFFIWWLLNKALPLQDNLVRFQTICPTICPFLQSPFIYNSSHLHPVCLRQRCMATIIGIIAWPIISILTHSHILTAMVDDLQH